MKKYLLIILLFIVFSCKSQQVISRNYHDYSGWYVIEHTYRHKVIYYVKVYKIKKHRYKLLAVYRKPYPILSDQEYVYKCKNR